MALFYRIVERKNPQKKDESPKYYMEAVKKGTIELEELALRATKNTTLNPYELIMGLKLTFKEAEVAISDGFTVNLTGLGYIRTTINGNGANSAEEVTAHNMKKIRPHFVFSRRFLRLLQRIRLEKR